MMKNKVFIGGLLFFLLYSFSSKAQFDTISQQVIGSAGGTAAVGVFSWGTLDYTVGEAVIWTYDTATTPFTVKVLTQGFQQPNTANSSLDVNVSSTDATCIGGNNGSAILNLLSATGPVSYYWLAPLNDSTPLQTNLAPGTYYFHMDDGNFTIDDSVVIGETQVDCADSLGFYTGITPNGDGFNDTWIIEGIELVKDNVVSIYNRWGDLVWTAKDYDNITDGKVWKGTNSRGELLPDATYFYLIEVSGKTEKGWVELTH